MHLRAKRLQISPPCNVFRNKCTYSASETLSFASVGMQETKMLDGEFGKVVSFRNPPLDFLFRLINCRKFECFYFPRR
jgi:hypothetical protein